MTEQQDEDEPDFPTAADAKREWTEHIAWLRAGDKGQRRLADLLAQCRKGKRCNLVECPKCERRKTIARLKVPAAAVKTIGSHHPLSNIRVGAIIVDGKRRPLNSDKVRAFAASMELIGLQTPITVQERRKQVRLVTGAHRLAAAKKLGWDTIPSIVLLRDKIQTRIWQIVENLYRAELTALERAELTEELRQLVRQQEVQLAPPGGVQPQDKGINKAAKVLDSTKEEIRRSRAIAGIAPKAKDKVRKLGLDDNQRALLEIATQPTPKAQLHVIEEIVERKRAVRNRASAAAADKKTTGEINSLEADILEKEGDLKNLKRELATNRTRLQEIRDKLVVQGEVAGSEPPSEEDDLKQAAAASTEDCASDVMGRLTVEDMMPAAEAERLQVELATLTERARHAEDELEAARARASRTPAVDASMKTPTDGDIPAFLDQHLLSPDDQLTLDAVMAAWADATALRAALLGVSPVVEERFVAALRVHIASPSSAVK